MKNKKILVTGADGFIGSHLTEILVNMDAEVTALSQYNSFNYWGNLEDLPNLDEVKVVSGDIRDAAFCRNIIKDQDIVFNLAALIAIPYSYIAPDAYIDTNVKGALNVAQAAREHGTERVIQISTSEVYGTACYVPIDEKHPLQPQSPYSASKIGADNIAMSFFHAFEVPITIARPFNTYGPRQSARAVIPTIISQIAAGMEEVMLGDLTATRDFNYVTDTCRGLIALAQSEKTIGEVVNIGSNYEISISDVFNKINKIMKKNAIVKQDPKRIRPQGSEVFRLWCDNTKIKELCGFTPEFDIDKGLEKTIEWFLDSKNLSKYKQGIYNV
ncbi:LLPSF_family NAD dependent epimerase/dehydratase [uncultured Sporomusa sp.]|uniref:LLPSF_family NAD dependent epimerase/dehydratase n=1 Tax=uncultured Sporomusa sp. TaxID=307249 RepID=A0A212M1M4_9FIRM|nr:NAD-dependent 4,6-dehydratase LegB [uncultured Sporomusa sp.]SCM83630.1 LLPSF_family NAD dependent epimerase/dehydratase [uncultured Sporomusa sp.]